jgi:GNAT superfamily N-acetyltransferase
MNIRPATPADATVIAASNVALALETENLRLAPQTVRAGVLTLLQDPSKGLYLVAEIEGEIAGQIMVTYEWSDWRNATIWWLQSVYVAGKFRRRGVFRALLNHIIDQARSQNVCALRLYMERHNQTALAAYERLGLKLGDYVVLERPL